MNEKTREQKIADALASEEDKATPERREIPWQDGRELLTVIEVPLNVLLLNPKSHRIRAQLEAHPARTVVESSPESEQAQEAIAEILRSLRGFDTLKDDLAMNGQEEPGVITRQGVLVNANRRAVALRDLDKTYMRVMVLPIKASTEQINELELRLQVRRDLREEYSFTNNLLFIKDCLQNWNHKRVSRELGYTTQLGERKGVEKVKQAERILTAIEELREMSGKRYSYPHFDEAKEAFEDMDEAYEKLKKTDQDGAMRLREARMIGILARVGYLPLRKVGADFIDEYLKDVIEDNDELAPFSGELLGGNGNGNGDSSPGVSELLGGSSDEDSQSGAGLLEWMTQNAGRTTVTFVASGQKIKVDQAPIVEALQNAFQEAANQAKDALSREDRNLTPKKRLSEARSKVRTASSAFKDVRTDKQFTNKRLASLLYEVKKLDKSVQQLRKEIEAEETRRNKKAGTSQSKSSS